MGVYIGYFENNRGEFYNFWPIAERKDSEIVPLSNEMLKSVLNQSEMNNIRFTYKPEERNDLERMVQEKSLMIFEFADVSDLSSNGGGATKYRTEYADARDSGKLRSLSSAGVYIAIPSQHGHRDLCSDDKVFLGVPFELAGEPVFIQQNDFWAGPFEVHMDCDPGSYCIMPRAKEQKYTVRGYRKEHVHFLLLRGNDWCWPLICLTPDAVQEQFDVISNEALLEGLRDCLHNSRETDGSVQLEDLPALFDRYQNSILDGSVLTEEVRGARFDRLRQILNPEEAAGEALDSISDSICALLEKNRGRSNVDAVLRKLEQTQTAQNTIQALMREEADLRKSKERLQSSIEDLIDSSCQRMVESTFDGFVASKMLSAASQWEGRQAEQEHDSLVDAIRDLPTEGDKFLPVQESPRDVLDYLCKTVCHVRPGYEKEDIINIAVCMTQGFLTVFSGEPGCGKTSICNIFADTLGLNRIPEVCDCSSVSDPSRLRRYVPVSVERGWTSKRDFVGYYNPLSKTFDKSNRRVYDALHQLDTEKRRGIRKLPYVILLDEANLSPMEYYWSDFMNICDDLGPQSEVNLGEDFVFSIPETLHFVATINNDHTTEKLSPRLIDRSWVITLPKQRAVSAGDKSAFDKEIRIVTWDALRRAFIPEEKDCKFSDDIQKKYDGIVAMLEEQNISVSPRIEKAIKRYWAAASACFQAVGVENPGVQALDYAVMQKLLPKIEGHGEMFRDWLNGDLKGALEGLKRSKQMLTNIIERGDKQMKYYQFFH